MGEVSSVKKRAAARDGRGRQCAAVRSDHEPDSASGSKGSATSLPSAFLSRISTRPSASSSCFWHSRESTTPSSKSFMASSRESCGLSRRRTPSSRRASDFSKSGFFGGGVVTRWVAAPAAFYGTREKGNKSGLPRKARLLLAHAGQADLRSPRLAARSREADRSLFGFSVFR